MIKAKILCPMFIVVLTLSAALAASASATPEWQLNGKAITTAELLESRGSLVLTDMGGGPSKITCESAGMGTVGPGAASKYANITVVKCVRNEGPCEAAQPIWVHAIHLPWTGELRTALGKTRNYITSGGSGAPGYVIECTVLGAFKITDECSGPINVIAKNTAIGVSLEAEALSNEFEPMSCSVGGSKAGLIEGTITHEDPAGSMFTTT